MDNRPIWDFKDGRSDSLKFLFDSGKEVETKIGTRWIYTVEHEETEYTMFASYGLNADIEAKQIAKGEVLYITPIGNPRSKDCRYMVALVDAGHSKGAAPTRVAKPTPDDRVNSYIECLAMAMRVWHNDRIRAGLQKLGLDQASPDTRLMALKDLATHMSMGMGREWAFPPPDPSPPLRTQDEDSDLPF